MVADLGAENEGRYLEGLLDPGGTALIIIECPHIAHEFAARFEGEEHYIVGSGSHQRLIPDGISLFYDLHIPAVLYNETVTACYRGFPRVGDVIEGIIHIMLHGKELRAFGKRFSEDGAGSVVFVHREYAAVLGIAEIAYVFYDIKHCRLEIIGAAELETGLQD